MIWDVFLDLILYVVAVIGFIIVYKENLNLKKSLQLQNKEFDELSKQHKTLQKEFEELQKVDIKQRYDIKNLKAFKTEAARLRLLLQKVKDAYIQGRDNQHQTPLNSINEMEKLLKEEVKLLKDQEEILKQEEQMLLNDNKLLQQNNEILHKEIANLKEQVKYLRDANQKIPNYLATIDKLTREIDAIVVKHDS
ncbi:MAG: hypothetical protein IE909_07375 [Campylobacterales bacterium]|nr:hypothetical protein [Campylobacterales bacterium]